MHVLVNGVRLFFDVEGAQFVPDGPAMREKPTLLLLHGGPGALRSKTRRSKQNRRPRAPVSKLAGSQRRQELAFSTVTARRFCDQHEMSLQTATGRSLP
jgi:pimeloyl-ACP methyl ester carboxylesterase